MKFYNTFKRSNGRFLTQEWSASEMLDFDILKLVVIIVIGTLLSAITSLLCLGVRLYEYEENQKGPNIVGILFSGYLILDYFKGWFVSFILKLVETPYVAYELICLNIGLCLTHIMLLIFGDTIYYNANINDRKPMLWFISIMFLGIVSLLLIINLKNFISIS